MSTVSKTVDYIDSKIREAIGKGFPEAEIPAFTIEVPKEKEHGDFSTNAAMLLTKALRRAPRDIAGAIVENIPTDDLINRVEIAGPGFINFYLNPAFIYGALAEIEAMGADYGRTDFGGGKKVMVEFVSANPTGPMHMGNARGGAIGDCLAAVLDRAGYDVTREFYVNDAGAQIEKFGNSLYARYVEQLTGECDFPEDGYQGEDITEHAKNYIAIHGDKLMSMSKEDAKKELVGYAMPLNIDGLKTGLSRYRINYDVWFHESELYKSGEVEETLNQLREKGLAYEKDDALWFKSTMFGAEKDDVLIRTNGIPTYFAADIAYHRNKFLTRGYDKVINVWGADHHGHIARMKGAMEAFGIDPERLTVITMQLVRLMENGETVRMSKRTGKMITLSDLLDEIGISAARFFFNLRAAGSHFDFDLGLAVEKSNDNPVFYVQYAHARICSILRILEEEGIKAPAFADINPSLLCDEREIELIKKLADLPDEIQTAAELYEPSRLTRYVMDTAALFHSFYNSCHVKCEDEALRNARLNLVKATKTVIANVLDMLGVDAPEKM